MLFQLLSGSASGYFLTYLETMVYSTVLDQYFQFKDGKLICFQQYCVQYVSAYFYIIATRYTQNLTSTQVSKIYNIENFESAKQVVMDVHDWGVNKIKGDIGNFSQRALTMDKILNQTADAFTEEQQSKNSQYTSFE